MGVPSDPTTHFAPNPLEIGRPVTEKKSVGIRPAFLAVFRRDFDSSLFDWLLVRIPFHHVENRRSRSVLLA